MTNVENFNDQGKVEEIFNAISHGLGARTLLSNPFNLFRKEAYYGEDSHVRRLDAWL